MCSCLDFIRAAVCVAAYNPQPNSDLPADVSTPTSACQRTSCAGLRREGGCSATATGLKALISVKKKKKSPRWFSQWNTVLQWNQSHLHLTPHANFPTVLRCWPSCLQLLSGLPVCTAPNITNRRWIIFFKLILLNFLKNSEQAALSPLMMRAVGERWSCGCFSVSLVKVLFATRVYNAGRLMRRSWGAKCTQCSCGKPALLKPPRSHTRSVSNL